MGGVVADLDDGNTILKFDGSTDISKGDVVNSTDEGTDAIEDITLVSCDGVTNAAEERDFDTTDEVIQDVGSNTVVRPKGSDVPW